MSAAFTPGPWYASEPFAGFGAIKQTETNALVFGLAAGDPDEKQPDETCEANARLIAAAPELYEALERCVMKLRRCAENAGNADFAVDAVAEPFEAVLAKARGDQ